MAGNLTWKAKPDAPSGLELSGDITEASDFSKLLADLQPHTDLDLAGLAHINSTGVREWLLFVRAVEKANKTLALHRCSVSFVQQLNMIAGFAGSSKVCSILAPYACPSCDEIGSRLIDAGRDVTPQYEEPMPCPACGDLMIFDDIPEHYFRFLRGSAP